MKPEYIAIIVLLSVCGGVIFLALVVTCVIKSITDMEYKKKSKLAKQMGYTNRVSLQSMEEPPSYVHYPDPEPNTPEGDPWRMGHGDAVNDQNPSQDISDHVLPGYDPFRRPSMARYPPYASDILRRGSYAQGISKRPSNVGVQRKGSRAVDMKMSRSFVGPADRLPTRRSSLLPNPELPQGDEKKLWYYYINEEPDYFSPKGLQRNRRVSKEWSEKGVGLHSASFSKPQQRPMSYPQMMSNPTSSSLDPRTQWM